MTGYGAYQGQNEICAQFWEIKSVNAKYLNLRWRAPVFLQAQEQLWEQKVREVASRGRVDISLNLRLLQKDLVPVRLDRVRAGAMLGQLQELAQDQSLQFMPDINRLLNISGLWEEQDPGVQEKLQSVLLQGLEQAVHDWDQARSWEGQSLTRDLLQRVARMQGWMQKLHDATRDLADQKLQALQDRLQQAAQDTDYFVPDEYRLWQELAILADKTDVSEELTRLENHLQGLQDILEQEPGAGRKLDFVLQECFREINTCGNKAQDAMVSRIVVDFKTELEKCREQVQNLE